MRHEAGHGGGFRVLALLFVASLTVASAGCGGTPTGGGAGENPRPIETEAENTRDAASGSGRTAGSGAAGEEGTSKGDTSSTRVEVSTLATGLRVPWSFAFLPDGDALVTERDSGRILRVSSSGDAREVQRLPEGGVGEGGLLGIAVSPGYEEDRYVYAYTTTEADNRVVRFRLGGEPEPVLTGIPANS